MAARLRNGAQRMIVQSLRLGARKIVRYPGISAVTFLTLAIGIAVSATIFAVTWATLIRPFAFADQDRLVQLWATQGDIAKLELSYDEFLLIRSEAKSIESMAAISAANFPVVLKRRGEPMQLHGNLLGDDFFRTLGIKPHLGRSFTAGENRAGGSNAALLSYRTWQSRFGGDPNVTSEVLGNTDGSGPVPIVGVLPKDLELPSGADIVFPVEAALPDADARANHVLSAIAKLRRGATIDDLRRELAVITAHEQNLHPETHPRITQHAYPLVDELLGSTKSALRIILAMGLLVLLIALFNTASVALAQGIGRTAELGVRRAVGSTRTSNLLRFFLEASVLSLAAGAAGFVAARALLAALLQIAPPATPRIAEVHIGWETAAWAAGGAGAAGGGFAGAPVFRRSDSRHI
jgi:ABC-type antimicrobial peptide transport system permease subunit